MPHKGSALGLALVMVACTSMRRVEPAEFIPQHNPPLVSVWTRPDDVTIVTDPQVRGDTLTGVVFDEPWGVLLKDVIRVEADAPSPGRTVLLVAGSAASIVLVTSLMNKAGSKGGSQPCFPWQACGGVQTNPP